MNAALTADEAIEVIKKHYNTGDIDYCMHIRRGFNDTYLLDTGHRKFIFRIYLNGKYYVESDDAYRFELNLIKHLYKQGVPVANVVPTSDGELLGVAELANGQSAFALFDYAEGLSWLWRICISLRTLLNPATTVTSLI